jgi:ribosome-binding protein aMBF1 (putative translation factor)
VSQPHSGDNLLAGSVPGVIPYQASKPAKRISENVMEEHVDDLDVAASEWSSENPEYAFILEGYRANQALLEALAEQRTTAGLSQRQIAERMGTSQSAVNRIEAGEIDPRLSTIQRLATALGLTIRWELVPITAGHPAAERTADPATPEHAAAGRPRMPHAAAS